MRARRNFGIARTLPAALPRNCNCADSGRRMVPTLPSGPPPGSLASGADFVRYRRTGQKYADWSSPAQVVPAAARLSLVEKPSVDLLPT